MSSRVLDNDLLIFVLKERERYEQHCRVKILLSWARRCMRSEVTGISRF